MTDLDVLYRKPRNLVDRVSTLPEDIEEYLRGGASLDFPKVLGVTLNGATFYDDLCTLDQGNYREVYAATFDPVALIGQPGKSQILTYPLSAADIPGASSCAWASKHMAIYNYLIGLHGNALPSAWGHLFSDLARWAVLPKDWDGDDGSAPTAAAIASSESFAAKLKENGLPHPEHFISGDGEISFDWREGDAAASMSFFSDGSAAGYVQNSKGAPLLEIEVCDARTANFSEFFEALKRFA